MKYPQYLFNKVSKTEYTCKLPAERLNKKQQNVKHVHRGSKGEIKTANSLWVKMNDRLD
jgi:hypothetical protein